MDNQTNPNICSILLKDLRCSIENEKVEKTFQKLLKKTFTKESNKIQLEFKYNNEQTRTILSPARMSNSNTITEASWDEHIHFNLDTLNPSGSNKLVITCWDASIKPDGRLGEIAWNLANFEKSDEFDSKINLKLRSEDSKPKVEVEFYLYFLSNRPPIEEMKKFDDLSLRNKIIGMLLIDNLEYENLYGNVGPLKFILQEQSRSTAEYWQIDSQQQEKRSKWKRPIGMFLVARPDNLVIHFKTNSKGLAKTKISVGPSGEMESIWPSLMNGGPISVTSRHIFGKEKGKSVRPEHTNDTLSRSVSLGPSSVSSFKDNASDIFAIPPTQTIQRHHSLKHPSNSSFKNSPSEQFAISPTQTTIVQRQHSLKYNNEQKQNERNNKYLFKHRNSLPYNFNRDNISNNNQQYMNQHHKSIISQVINNNQTKFQSGNLHERRDSNSSSETSKSSKKKIDDKRQQIRNDKSSINIHFQQDREMQDYANNSAYRPTKEVNINSGNKIATYENVNETRQDLSFSSDKKTQPLTIPYNKNIPSNIEHHIKIGNSPPVNVGFQDCEHREIPLERNMYIQQNFQQHMPQNIPFGFNTTTFHNDNTQLIFNRYEIISPLQRATSSHNKVYLGQHTFTMDQVIIKQYKFHSRWENERRFLKELKSKLIVKLEEVSINPTNEQECLIVTKFYGKPLDEVAGDIYDNKEYIKKVFWNICIAVDWCHKNGVVHMDLNPSNIICKDRCIHRIRLCCILYYLNTKNLLFTTEKELEHLSLTKISESIEDERVSILVKWLVAETGNERPKTTQVLKNSFFDSIRI
ncbi:4968_t:CDS:2 [Funneliformis geosporum]|nr:4968_t:CDS:2 [Funneliformis geosporum]